MNEEAFEMKKAAHRGKARYLPAAAACLALVILLIVLFIPNYRLNRAKKLASSGNYETAYALLKGLDHRDSAALAEEYLFRAQTARLGDVAVGSTIRFGSCEQDNRLSNGAEEIEWLVLAVEGDKALLVSRYGLEPRPYNEELYLTDSRKKVTWST